MDYMRIQTLARIAGFSGLLLMAACRDKEPDALPAPDVTDQERKVYVICEGNMGSGNSALTLYLPGKDSVYEDVFRMANQYELGDVFLSMTGIGGNYWLCVNNSDKIVIVDTGDWKVKKELPLSKPRYIQQVDAQHGYLSSIFDNKLYTLDLHLMQVSGSIALPARNPEGMLLHGNRLYVCAWDTANRELFGLDAATGQIVQRIELDGVAPQGVVADKNGKLWVFSGDAVANRPAYVTQIDPVSGSVLKSLPFPGTGDLVRPVWNKTRDTLYFIAVDYDNKSGKNGVYRISIDAQALPEQPFVAAGAYQYFWALGIDPVTGNIYVGDPRGFIQKGIVYIYRPDGTLAGQFSSGVGPGHFYFPGS